MFDCSFLQIKLQRDPKVCYEACKAMILLGQSIYSCTYLFSHEPDGFFASISKLLRMTFGVRSKEKLKIRSLEEFIFVVILCWNILLQGRGIHTPWG